jgi:glycosyltransferase involved in cell wall biosynthesis
MKLMLLVEQYPPDINVAGLRMHEMVNTFSEHEDTDVRVVVYNPLSKTRYLRRFTKISEKVSVVRYGRKYLPGFFHLMSPINPFSFLFWTFISINESISYKPDIIITTVPSFIPTIAAYLTSIIHKKPFCIDIRDNWINTNIIDYTVKSFPLYGSYPCKILYTLYYYLFLRSCKNALLLCLVYESMREDLLKLTNFEVPVINVPNGVNFSELERIKQKFNKEEILSRNGIFCRHESKFVIHAGLIGLYYKSDVILVPLKRLIEQGEDIGYIIVGEGPEKEAIKDAANNMGIENHVFLLGKKEHSELIALLLASDVAFYALDEKFPNPDCALGTKVLEYAACKLPILAITGENSIVSRFITERKIGITLRWNEINWMHEALQELINHEKYSENIETNYSSFIKEFDRRLNNNRIYQEIAKCLDHE